MLPSPKNHHRWRTARILQRRPRASIATARLWGDLQPTRHSEARNSLEDLYLWGVMLQFLALGVAFSQLGWAPRNRWFEQCSPFSPRMSHVSQAKRGFSQLLGNRVAALKWYRSPHHWTTPTTWCDALSTPHLYHRCPDFFS